MNICIYIYICATRATIIINTCRNTERADGNTSPYRSVTFLGSFSPHTRKRNIALTLTNIVVGSHLSPCLPWVKVRYRPELAQPAFFTRRRRPPSPVVVSDRRPSVVRPSVVRRRRPSSAAVVRRRRPYSPLRPRRKLMQKASLH